MGFVWLVRRQDGVYPPGELNELGGKTEAQREVRVRVPKFDPLRIFAAEAGGDEVKTRNT